MRWIAPLAAVLIGAACGKVSETPTCEANELACGGACIDPQRDNDHCGQCDLPCTGGLVCGNGMCAEGCPTGQELCGGTCTDTQTDADHCGTCDNACAADQECREGSCQVRCDVGLTSPVTDPWGYQWDGLERDAAALDIATATCAGFGARLPTATELYRVSANQSATVGMSFHTNYLWSTVPATRLEQATLRLSDATATSTAATSTLTYRCVCAPPQPAFFGGTRCNGPAGDACATVGRSHIDKSDRPALRLSSAVWECANEHAHVADLATLVEAIQAGVPGSGAYVATSDRAQADQAASLRWTTAAGWEVSGNLTTQNLRTLTPFRCAGPSFISGTHPAAVPNEFTAGPYKSEAADAAAAGWVAAHDACFARGGHLPRSSELAELIMQGLPGGSDAYLWTGDQAGYDGNQFRAATVKWAGLDKRFPYEQLGNATQTATWHLKNTSQVSRCIYYPIDPMYQPPAACNGGCVDVNPPVGPTKMVVDAMDRPAASPAAAMAACTAAGGRLATERDLTEAIRAGLPNGSNALLTTADVGRNDRVQVVRWTGVDTGFTDQYQTYMTWRDPATAGPYRCVWTNELR